MKKMLSQPVLPRTGSGSIDNGGGLAFLPLPEILLAHAVVAQTDKVGSFCHWFSEENGGPQPKQGCVKYSYLGTATNYMHGPYYYARIHKTCYIC